MQQNQANNPLLKNQQLATLLRQCSYQQIQQVNNVCFQIFSQFPDLSPTIQTMKIGNTTHNVIELVGNVGIQYRNTVYYVVTHVVFPLQFPFCAPAFRVKNPNSDKFGVNSKYINQQTPDNFINLYLSEAQAWSTHQNTLRLFQQMQKEFSDVFPFFEKVQSQQNPVANSPVASAQNNANTYQQQQQPQQSYGQQTYGSSYNYNPSIPGYGQFNQPQQQQQQQQQGYGQYQGMQQQQQPPPNPFGPGQVIGNPVIMNPPQQQQQQQQPQQNYAGLVTAKLKNEIEPIYKKLMDQVKEERSNLDSIYQLKLKADENDAAINQLEEDLKEKIDQIILQTSELKEFVSQNDQITITKENVATFISEESPLQTQILTLVAEKDALKETFSFAESAFKEKRINLDTLIRTTQQLSEQEFDNKLLLKKCVIQIQKG